MTLTITGDAIVARPFHAISSIQFQRSNILTSASFTPPPRKSWLDKLVEFLRSEGKP